MKHFTKEEQEKYTESIRKVFNLPEEYLRRADEKLPSDSKELKKDYLKLRSENTLLGERCNQLLKDKGDLEDKVAELELQIEGMRHSIKDLIKVSCDHCFPSSKTNCNTCIYGSAGKVYFGDNWKEEMEE